MTDTPTVDEALARLNMPLLDAMMTQRAVRRVLPDPADDAIVLKCIELALRAPCCVVPLGQPRGRYGPTTRKPVEEVAHLDGYGNRAGLNE